MARDSLDLALEPERIPVRIRSKEHGDAECEIRHPDELGIVERRRMGMVGQKIRNLWASEKLTRSQEGALQKAVDELVSAVLLDCPPELFGQLGDGHRFRIAETFIEQLTEAAEEVEEGEALAAEDRDGES